MPNYVLQLSWDDIKGTYGGIQSVVGILESNLPSLSEFSTIVRILPVGNYYQILTPFSAQHICLGRLRSEVEALIRRHEIRIVHTHNIHRPNGPGVAEALAEVFERMHIQHIATVHDLVESVSREELKRQRDILSKARCITTSQFISSQLRKLMDIEPLRTIELGIPFPARDQAEGPSGQLTLCAPGRLLAQKGLLDAVIVSGHISVERGCTRLLLSSKQNPHNGGAPRFLEEVARLATCFPNLTVEFFGGQNPVPDMYRRAHLTLCLPQMVEGFGLIPLESVASGRPVVAIPNGGMSWVQNYDAIITVTTRDLVKVVDAVNSVIADWSRWHARTVALYEDLSQRFSADRMTREYAETYRMVFAEPALSKTSLET